MRINLVFAWLLLLSISCSSDQRTEETDNEVLERFSGADLEPSLFGGLYFGMKQKAFFAHCMAKQKKGEMRDGLGNYVQMDLPEDPFGPGVKLEFYPVFNPAGEIIELPGRVYSQGWGPWNEKASPDSLAIPFLAMIRDQFGGPAFEVQEREKPHGFVYKPWQQIQQVGARRTVVVAGFDQFLHFNISNLKEVPTERPAIFEFKHVGQRGEKMNLND